jgi:hypothetical protein
MSLRLAHLHSGLVVAMVVAGQKHYGGCRHSSWPRSCNVKESRRAIQLCLSAHIIFETSLPRDQGKGSCELAESAVEISEGPRFFEYRFVVFAAILGA